MRSWIIAIAGFVPGVVVGAATLFLVLSPSAPPVATGSGATPTVDLPKTGTLRLVCDLELDKGKDVLGINPSETKRIASVGIDFERSSGWYDGALAISESRPGTLTQEGDLLKVSRPAMFQRFGAKISGESFSVNRQTGEFQQQLTIDTGFALPLIRGQCARLAKAPF